MLPIPNIDHQIKETYKININLIKDKANSILTQQVHPPPTAILTHFKGPSILTNYIERIDITIDIEIGEQRAKPEIFTAGKGAITTFAPASAATSEPARASTVPLTP